MTGPPIGTFPLPPQNSEKAQLQKASVPVAKNLITKENLQHAVAEVLKEVSSDSEKTAYVHDESAIASETYPSASNGATEQSADSKANTISFFNNLTEKIKSQVQSTFPEGYEFLEKVFNKKEPTVEDVFEIFDGICSSLEGKAYENLKGFKELSKEVRSGLENSLEELKKGLDSIRHDFKNQKLYKKPEGVSREEIQDWFNERRKVSNGLSSLEPAIKNIEAIINSLNSGILNNEQSFGVRIITSTLTALGYIASFFSLPGMLLFALSLATNFGFETGQFYLKQKIKEWENFKKPLDKLDKENPLVKGKDMNIHEVMPILYADNTKILEQQAEANKTQKEQTQTLDEMKAELIAERAEKAELKRELKEVNQRLDKVTSLVERLLAREGQQEAHKIIEAKA